MRPRDSDDWIATAALAVVVVFVMGVIALACFWASASGATP